MTEAKWVETATKDALLSGLGCPWCKHEGPYWVEPCRLHAVVQEICENAHIDRQVKDGLSATLDAIQEKLGIDPEVNPLPYIDDLIAQDPALTPERS